MADHHGSGRRNHDRAYRWVWDLRRNSGEGRSVGALIPDRTLHELIETLSALLLAFALYVTLKPVNKLLAQMAMYWRLAESLIGCVAIIFGFVRLRLYGSAQPFGPLGTDQSQALVNLTRQVAGAAGNIGVICFGIGSTLFFYLWRRKTSLAL